MRRLLLKILFLFCMVSGAFAQKNFTITGTVKSKIETLQGAGIYISGYKISTLTDSTGKFALINLAPGNYDILVQMFGYLPYTKNVTISDKSVNMDIVLTENVTILKEVVIRPDPDRGYYLTVFKNYFIGKSPNAAQCVILNESALITDYDRDNRILTVKANEFLIIENKALGYRLKYMLQFFEYDYKSGIIYYSGLPAFEELKGSNAKRKRWEKNRQIAYNGSLQHFYKSLYQNRVDEEGFLIYKLVKKPNPERKPDSLINANIKRLFEGQEGIRRVITFTGSDSLSYWAKQKKIPKLINTINRSKILVDTLVKAYDGSLKMMNFKDALYVVYKNERETPAYKNSGSWQSRPMDIPDYQISIINLLIPPILFYANGGIYDPRSTLYEGYWVYEKIADLVPLGYVPPPK